MRPFNFFSKSTALFALLFWACEPDPQTPVDYYDKDNFVLELEAPKSLGHGQYVLKAESGQELPIHIELKSPSNLAVLKVTKTINLVVDGSFGSDGEIEIPVSGNALSYDFVYHTLSSDVDELVGLTFEATNSSGQKEVSDLTLKVTLSPRDNIPRKKWSLVSILHVNEGNVEVIKDCEKDNAILFNADGTMEYLYGKDTGEGDCGFDGFNVYDKWTLSEDGKTFTIDYHGIFDPSPKTDSYHVRTLTAEEMQLELEVDLTVFGLGVETFLYTYKAGPK